MKFNLQLFGGGKGGSSSSYEPSEEQKELWNLQIESAKARQPNEKDLNEYGKDFMEKVKDLFDKEGNYYTQDDDHNFVQIGETAVNRANEQMVGLSTITTQFKKKTVTLSNGTTKEIYDLDDNGNLQPIFGRNYNDAKNLQTALCGTGKVLSTLKGSDGSTIEIKDNGYSGELGGYAQDAFDDFADYGEKFLKFEVGSDGKSGLNKNIGDLVTGVSGAVTLANDDIDDYDGKFDSAATIASGSVSTAQNKNNSLVSGLNTVIGGYNTLQSGKANNTESLLGGLNTSNNSAVTQAATILRPLITDTRNAATTANGNLDTIQAKGATALTTANNNLATVTADIKKLSDSTNLKYDDLITDDNQALRVVDDSLGRVGKV